MENRINKPVAVPFSKRTKSSFSHPLLFDIVEEIIFCMLAGAV
jgi:hypothetical protein